MKYEWKKAEKAIYLPKSEPTLIKIPRFKYFAIHGQGNPDNKDFADRVEVLYSLAYAVRMMPKNGITPRDYFEYTVYPLEGVWRGNAQDKSSYEYTIMIRQPDFVNKDVYNEASKIAERKKSNSLLKNTIFEEFEDGLSIQLLHIGSYDSEPESFAAMNAFATEHGYSRTSTSHREIYLTDPAKVSMEKQKTVLRYSVQ